MRLLLAENEKTLVQTLVAMLKHGNYSVDVVYDGADALNHLETGLYDAAILDAALPRLDGVSVVKRLRSLGINVPVLLLTSWEQEQNALIETTCHIAERMRKPVNREEFLSCLRAMTRQCDDKTGTVLSFEDIELDRSTFMLSSPTGSVRLPNKEYQIMEMFLARPGEIIPSEHFLDKIWGYDSDVEQNVVWVYLSCLRKKLTALDASVQIRAKRNKGYMLVAANQTVPVRVGVNTP